MKAKKKPLEELTLEQIGVAPNVRVMVKKMSAPAARKGGRKVDSVEALVQALQQEAKVI